MHSIKKLYAYLVSISLLLILITYINGCGEDDIVTNPSAHFEPAGLFLLPEGNTTDTIVAVFQGQLRSGDTFKVPLNVLTDHMDVFFWDENRNVLSPPTDGQHSLGYTIRDASVVETFMDDPSDWGFHLRGLSLNPDTTSIQIKVAHESHFDFTTPYIPVHVSSCEIPDPAGFVIEDTVTNQIVYRDSLGMITGDTIRINSAGSTNRLRIYYFDKEGDRFQPCVSEYTLSALFNPTGIANFTSKLGEWTFKVEAVANGTALMSLRLFRGANLFYGTRNIPVKVGP